MNDSTAWVSASMPVAAVMGPGSPVIRLGSSAAISGSSFGSRKNFFSCVSVSETTAATVTSEPVPAVVGMANSGAGGCFTLNFPSSLPSGRPLVAIAAIILPASIGDPPPNATTASQPSASY